MSPLPAPGQAPGRRSFDACRDHDAPLVVRGEASVTGREWSNRRSAQHHPLAGIAACVARLHTSRGTCPAPARSVRPCGETHRDRFDCDRVPRGVG